MEKTAISGVVLAGGKSSRMGSDKAWTLYKGKALIEHAIDSIKPYCKELIISAKGKAYSGMSYPVIADIEEGIGPIGGIASTLPHSQNELVLITACDIPLLSQKLISLLLDNSRNSDMAYLRIETGQFQPLPIILHKKLLAVVQAQIITGNYKLQDLINTILQQDGIHCSECIIDKEPLNMNRPEDLE